MSSNSVNSRYSNDDIKSNLLYKLISPIKKAGIANMRTDDIAKYMDLSKATLYKYFESKDDLIKNFVRLFIKYYVEMNSALDESEGDYQARYLIVFQKMLMLANYGTEVFMQDLRLLYPHLWEDMQTALTERNVTLRRFFESGIADGVFINTNPELLILQDESCFSKLVDPVFLVGRNLTIRQVLFDYYHLRVVQIFKPEFRPKDYNEVTLRLLETMSQKIATSMHS